jgi:hypothetical protein
VPPEFPEVCTVADCTITGPHRHDSWVQRGGRIGRGHEDDTYSNRDSLNDLIEQLTSPLGAYDAPCDNPECEACE